MLKLKEMNRFIYFAIAGWQQQGDRQTEVGSQYSTHSITEREREEKSRNCRVIRNGRNLDSLVSFLLCLFFFFY
uniref:Uncharacterized protein n=1 Tax=Rhizophora mucronata TaxID=61149 RepID=A0A2P2JGS8_RHIMU